MEEQIVNFDTAKLAKEKKFDSICYDTYDLRNKKLSDKYNIDLDEIYDEIDLKREFECRFDDIFEGYCLAPTQSLLQKWLRDKHHLNLEVFSFTGHIDAFEKICTWQTSLAWNKNDDILSDEKTYEEALEIGLQEALKLIVI
jgi:hypothetical protein